MSFPLPSPAAALDDLGRRLGRPATEAERAEAAANAALKAARARMHTVLRNKEAARGSILALATEYADALERWQKTIDVVEGRACAVCGDEIHGGAGS